LLLADNAWSVVSSQKTRPAGRLWPAGTDRVTVRAHRAARRSPRNAMDQRIKDLVGLLTQNANRLVQYVQGFDALTLAALLLVPVLTAAFARKVVLALASALLSLVSLMLIINPGSATTSVLGVAGGIGSFLLALASICGRRRSTALRDLQKEIEHLTERANRLEAAESRRLMVELKTKTNIAKEQP
jgi:hypothetical protein